MGPLAWSLLLNNGTSRALKVVARWSLHSGLENRRTLIAFPGFESLVSRQDLHESPAKAGLSRFWGLDTSDLNLLGVPELLWKRSITFLF